MGGPGVDLEKYGNVKQESPQPEKEKKDPAIVPSETVPGKTDVVQGGKVIGSQG